MLTEACRAGDVAPGLFVVPSSIAQCDLGVNSGKIIALCYHPPECSIEANCTTSAFTEVVILAHQFVKCI